MLGGIIIKYEITDETIALIPIDSSTTRIIELEKEYIVSSSAFNIMEENCEYYGSTYEGRVKSAKKILNFAYKIPVLVEETEKIIFFPTKSTSDNSCCWINSNLVSERKKEGKKIKVQFKNGIEEVFDISKLSFENQLLRANMLNSMLTKRISKK